MALILLILIIWKNFKLLTPPQSLGLRFSECQQKQKIRVCHNEKIGSHFVNINCTTECQWKWNIIRKLGMEMHIFFFRNFPLFHFSPILDSISILCMATLKTFMHGLPNAPPMCSFALPHILIFHSGRYSISVNIQKSRDPNFQVMGGGGE